jgi:DNA polymerase III epsilon subunit-like protein
MTPRTHPRATWFCVDIECNGPVPGLYDMASLAAVVVAEDGSGELRVQQSWTATLKPGAPRYDARAAAIHGLNLETLRRDGLERGAFCAALTAWVVEQTRPGTEPVFVGHNAPFDWSFVAWTFAAESLRNPFGYKALCTKSMATGALGIHWLDSGKETLAERLSLPAEDLSQKHDALYDALYQADILMGLLARA